MKLILLAVLLAAPATGPSTQPSYEDLLAENARLRHEVSMLRAQVAKLTDKPPTSRPARPAPAKKKIDPLSNPDNIAEALKVGMSKEDVAAVLQANGWGEMKRSGADEVYEGYESSKTIITDIRNLRYGTIRVYLRFAEGKLSAFTK